MKGPQIFFVVILVLGAFWVGSKTEFFGGGNVTQSGSATEGLPLGARVTVQIRRDHLSSGNDLLVPPTTTVMNGASVAVDGTLTGISKDWVVVNRDDLDHWVVRDSVMMIIVHP